MQRYDLRKNDDDVPELVVSENGEFVRYADVRLELDGMSKAGAEAQERASAFSRRIDELEKSIETTVREAVEPVEIARAKAVELVEHVRKVVARTHPDERDAQIAALKADLEAVQTKVAGL